MQNDKEFFLDSATEIPEIALPTTRRLHCQGAKGSGGKCELARACDLETQRIR